MHFIIPSKQEQRRKMQNSPQLKYSTCEYRRTSVSCLPAVCARSREDVAPILEWRPGTPTATTVSAALPNMTTDMEICPDTLNNNKPLKLQFEKFLIDTKI